MAAAADGAEFACPAVLLDVPAKAWQLKQRGGSGVYFLTEYTPHEPRSRESGSGPSKVTRTCRVISRRPCLALYSHLLAKVTRGSSIFFQDGIHRKSGWVSLQDTSTLRYHLLDFDVR